MLRTLENIAARISSLLSIVSYSGITVATSLIVADVILRFCFGEPILGSYELVERIQMCTVFASFSYAATQHAHVHVSMLIMHFPRRIRLFCYGLTELAGSGMAFVTAYALVRQARMAARSSYTTGVLFIPLAPFFWFAAVCMVTFGIAMLIESLKGFMGMRCQDIAQEVENSWN